MQLRLPKSAAIIVCVLIAACDYSLLPSDSDNVDVDTRIQVSGLVVSALDQSPIEGSTVVLSVERLFDERIVQEMTTRVDGRFLVVGTANSLICDVNLKISAEGYVYTMITSLGVQEFTPSSGWIPRETEGEQPRIQCTEEAQEIRVEMRSKL